jgi:hypothetical protein
VIISGATGDECCEANGIFLFLGVKDDRPLYKNLVNQSRLHYASDSKWYVSNKADLELKKITGWCRSVEAGWGHPSPLVTVATMVLITSRKKKLKKTCTVVIC